MSDDDKFVFTYPYKSKVSSRLNPETGNYEIVGKITYPAPNGPVWKFHEVPAVEEMK